MNFSRLPRLALLALTVATWAFGAVVRSSEIVLFPFDDYNLPLNKGLLLNLAAGSTHKRQDPRLTDRPVLPIGQPGDPDHPRAYFCGTILKIGDEYRLWYTGFDKDRRR